MKPPAYPKTDGQYRPYPMPKFRGPFMVSVPQKHGIYRTQLNADSMFVKAIQFDSRRTMPPLVPVHQNAILKGQFSKSAAHPKLPKYKHVERPPLVHAFE